MTQFRPHRGLLAEAMAEVCIVESREELQRRIGHPIEAIKYYTWDDRIKWDTYIVTVKYPDGIVGVAGFTDGPLNEEYHMTVRSIDIMHTDTLQVTWRFEDGTTFKEYLTIPPKDVRDARTRTQVIDRLEETSSGQKM